MKDISLHEGAVQVQKGVIFYSYAAFNNTEDWREDYCFMGPLCCYHWAARQKKMLWVIASLGWNGKYDTGGNYIQKGVNGSVHGVLVQLPGSKAQWNGHFNSEILGQIRHTKSEEGNSLRATTLFKPPVGEDNSLLWSLSSPLALGD